MLMRASLPPFDDWFSQDGYSKLLALPRYFALVPAEAPMKMILDLGMARARALGLDWRRYGQTNPHVTISPVERLMRVRGPPDVIRTACAAVSCQSFDATFDRVESFKIDADRHPLVLRCDDRTTHHVRSLGKSIEQAMHAIGIKIRPTANITPHITMLYDPLQRSIAEPITPISWRVDDFVLIRSHVGHSMHETLGHWPLIRGSS